MSAPKFPKLVDCDICVSVFTHETWCPNAETDEEIEAELAAMDAEDAARLDAIEAEIAAEEAAEEAAENKKGTP